MNIDDRSLEKARRIQQNIESKLMAKDGVEGTTISTMPGQHDQICIKIIVDRADITTTSLGLPESSEGIPFIISFEKNLPM